MAQAVNINDVLDGHVVLDLQCLDRVYLNGYVPKLQVAGQVVTFLTEHLGNPIPSPVLFKHIGDRFREAVRTFAETHDIPVLHVNTPDRTRWDDRKVDHVREYIDQRRSPESSPSSWRKRSRRSLWATRDAARPARHSSASIKRTAG